VRSWCTSHGGRVYVDGANMNALVGVAAPGEFGGDVSHLNLHKTFCIPHGGGGPGVGPVCVVEDLVPFLPGHATGGEMVGAVSAAPLGNAAVLPISWMYIRMMGADGLQAATEAAILSANYISARLKDHYPTLYASANGHVAHECILDLRGLKDTSGVMAEDVAKRLIDYGFHAPTLSFPVPNTLMVEPTESETLAELDRFIDAMIAIRRDPPDRKRRLAAGQQPAQERAAHRRQPAGRRVDRPYSREVAAYPVAALRQAKYWSPVGRVDNVYGDRNLFCSCVPVNHRHIHHDLRAAFDEGGRRQQLDRGAQLPHGQHQQQVRPGGHGKRRDARVHAGHHRRGKAAAIGKETGNALRCSRFTVGHVFLVRAPLGAPEHRRLQGCLRLADRRLVRWRQRDLGRGRARARAQQRSRHQRSDQGQGTKPTLHG
jgi:hypothetical protein